MLSKMENEHPKIKWAVFQEQHRTEAEALAELLESFK